MDVRYHYGDVLVIAVCLTIFLLLGWLSVELCPLWMLCLQLTLYCILFKAHGGKLKAFKDFLIHPPTIIVEACTTSLLSILIWGCLSFSPLSYHTPPHTPYPPNTPNYPTPQFH